MRYEVAGVLVVRQALVEAERLVHRECLGVLTASVQTHDAVPVVGGGV